MKKSKIIVLLLLGFTLGALAAVGVYFLTEGEVAWQEYVETKLIPNAVLALSSVSALCIAALPLVSKIQASVAKFNQATSDVNSTVANGKKTDTKLAEQDEKIEDFSERFDQMEKMFTEGFAFDDGEVRQNYESSRAVGDSEFLAVVKDYHDGVATVEMRSRFQEGQMVEILSPTDSFAKKVEIKNMRNQKGEPVQDAKIVQQILSFDCPYQLQPFDILRTV